MCGLRLAMTYGWCRVRSGQVSADAMSDGEIRQLFRIIDEDDSGDISIDEVTHLIWGDNAGLVSNPCPTAYGVAKAPLCDRWLRQLRVSILCGSL